MKILGRTFFEKPVEQHKLGADHIKPKVSEADKGSVETSYTWTERIPHPNNMGNYEKWSLDPEAGEALTVLSKLIAGVGYHTEMPDSVPENQRLTHPNKVKVDQWAEDVNLDEHLEKVEWQKLAKGFSPVEKVTGYDGQFTPKLLPAETFYIYRDKKGTVTKYTQERSQGDILAEWKGDEINDIVLFTHQETPLRPYGTSILESIGMLLDMRSELNADMKKGIHRWANPIPILETTKSKANSEELKKSLTEREADEWVLVYDVEEGELRWQPLTVEPSGRFVPYVEMIYFQICEGLHAPLLLYLKNATEASAHVMMESVDRLVEGNQRYDKRRVERFYFKSITGDPVPRMMWGKQRTGLENATVLELTSLINSPKLAYNQTEYILKQHGIQLPIPDWKSGPPQPVSTPFGGQKPVEKPKTESIDQLVEQLNNLDTGLGIIATNFDEGKLPVTTACQMAERTIKVHMQRAYPNDWETRTQEAFRKFVSERIMGKVA